jgi:hypothetical protein
MPVPWLRILDALIGVTDLARSRRIRTLSQGPADRQQLIERGPASALSGVDARLAGVVVAALKEVFDRDRHRLELEREQIEADRARADRALQLELRRQAGDREISRLRLLAGVAVACWMGTLFWSARLIGGAVGARAALGGGWAFLLAAAAAAFSAQSAVGAALDRGDDPADDREAPRAGVLGALAMWLIVIGLALVGLAVLIA